MNLILKFSKHIIKALILCMPTFLVFKAEAFDLQISNWRNPKGDQRLRSVSYSDEDINADSKLQEDIQLDREYNADRAALFSMIADARDARDAARNDQSISAEMREQLEQKLSDLYAKFLVMERMNMSPREYREYKNTINQQEGYRGIESSGKLRLFPTTYELFKAAPGQIYENTGQRYQQLRDYGRQKASDYWQQLKGYGSRATEFGRGKAQQYGILPKPIAVG